MVQVENLMKPKPQATVLNEVFIGVKSGPFGLNSCSSIDRYDIAAFSTGTEVIAALSQPMLESNSSNPNDDLFSRRHSPLTPPLSPVRTFGDSSVGDDLSDYEDDRLRLHSDQLDDSDLEELTELHLRRPLSAGYLQSKLISDCMWSGQRERTYSTLIDIDFTSKGTPVDDLLYPTPCPTPPPPLSTPVSTDLTDILSPVACPNPTAAFSLSRNLESIAGLPAGSSDSDEEIDVVTVDSRKSGRASGRCTSLLEASSTSGVADRTPSKRKLVMQDSTLTAKGVVKPTTVGVPFVASDPPRVALACPSLRRTKSSPAKVCHARLDKATPKLTPMDGSLSNLLPAAVCGVTASLSDASVRTSPDRASVRTSPDRASLCSSPDSAPLADVDVDGEPEVKRACHNTLERNRRVNLKLSFDKLREVVPSFGPSEKVAKVAILQKATSHIDSLQREEVELESEKCRLEMRRQALLEKLRRLSPAQAQLVV